MKKLLNILCLLCLASPLWAQQNFKLAAGNKTIEFREIDELNIVGATGSELVVEGMPDADNDDQRAVGLRKISASGLSDNTGLGLSVTESGGRILVQQIGSGDHPVTVRVPNSATIVVEQSTHRGGDLTVSDFGGAVDVSMMYHKATLKNLSGAVAVNTVYDDIIATWDTAPTSEVRLHSTYSDVDVTLPGSTRADLRMATSYGNMYTDFDIQMEPNMVKAGSTDATEERAAEGEANESGRQVLSGTIGGGGKLLALTSTYDNVYIRKQ